MVGMTDQIASGAQAAVDHVAERAAADRTRAERRLAACGIDRDTADRAIDDLRHRTRLTLNFHPDRIDASGRTVAAGLLADGRYRSQFETGISNGGRTAVPGGDRTRWERTLFGGAYDGQPDGSASPRPVYGALDPFGDPYGGSPRFGSSFVVLRPACLDRATLSVGDSHLGPTDVGTADQLWPILAGAVEACVDGDGFGRGLDVDRFLQALEVGADGHDRPSARELDRYVEAQVHGPIDLAADVAAIHLDPSFDGTDVHRDLREVASRYGTELAWSEGSEVRPEAIEPGFRGPEIAALAHRTSGDDGLIDAAVIGRALADLAHTPPSQHGDDEASPRQRYKKLWHCCLAFGTPPSRPRPPQP